MKICVDGTILESNDPLVVEQWIKYGHKAIEDAAEDEEKEKETVTVKKRRKKAEV